jgi:branched-chain amino acid transport system permease protein
VSGRTVRNAVVALVVLGAFATLPWLRESLDFPVFYLVFLSTVLFWIAQATSWNILSGYSGYFSFGQGAFVGVAAYTVAVLAGRHGLNFFLTVALAGAFGVVLALAIGGLAFRLRSLRGEIFALLTLAVPFILAALARINSEIDGGQGVFVPVVEVPESIGGFQELVYLLNLGAALLALVIAIAMEHSRAGWALFAIRDAEDVAEGLGVPTFAHKMLAISATGFIAGISGSVFALQIGFVTVEAAFGLTIPLFVIVMSVLGGRAHWLGPVIGALVIVTLQDRLSASGLDDWNLVIFGVVLALLVLIAPEGLYARYRRRPRATLLAFGVTFLALAVVRVWDEPLDWLAAALVVGAVAALWPVRRRTRAGADTPVEAATEAIPLVPDVATPAAEAPPPDDVPAEAVIVGPTEAVDRDRPVIECVDVTKRFGGVEALSGISLAVGPGELVGLVGPNGSGKTTLVNLLSGVMRPTSGDVRIAGQTAVGLTPHRIAHLGVARTYQIPRPFESMTVRDNVAMAIMFGREGTSLAEARRQATQHLELVGLDRRAGQHPLEINLHERQLLEMARAVATRPRVLLLDEALAGLNPVEIDNAVSVVRAIHESGIVIVIVEHLLRVVTQLATRMVVLDQGRCLADGEPDVVLRESSVIDAYLGRHAHAQG